MEVIKSAGSGSFASNYFADPYVLELLISGFVGSNLKARIAIHEFVDKQLLLARDEERRIQGQLDQAQERRQELELMNSLLDLFDSLGNINEDNQTILIEITSLVQRLKSNARPLSDIALPAQEIAATVTTVMPITTTHSEQVKLVEKEKISHEETLISSKQERHRLKFNGQLLPSQWRIVQKENNEDIAWVNFHGKARKSGNRLPKKLLATGQLIRPFVPSLNMLNPKLVCGCSLETICFGFLIIGYDKSSQQPPTLPGRYCLEHMPTHIEVEFADGTKKTNFNFNKLIRG